MRKDFKRVDAIGYRPGRVATLGDFTERWKIEVLSKQEPSSIRAVKSHLKCYLVPHLSQLRILMKDPQHKKACHHERHLSGNALKIYNLLWRLCKKSRTGTVALSNRRIAQLIEARCDGKRADYITRIKMALARSC